MSRPHGRDEPNRGYARRDDDWDRDRDRDENRSRGPEVSHLSTSLHLCLRRPHLAIYVYPPLIDPNISSHSLPEVEVGGHSAGHIARDLDPTDLEVGRPHHVGLIATRATRSNPTRDVVMDLDLEDRDVDLVETIVRPGTSLHAELHLHYTLGPIALRVDLVNRRRLRIPRPLGCRRDQKYL